MSDDCPRALINRERVGEGDPTLRALGVSRGFDFDSGNYRCSVASSSSLFPMICSGATAICLQLCHHAGCCDGWDASVSRGVSYSSMDALCSWLAAVHCRAEGELLCRMQGRPALGRLR